MRDITAYIFILLIIALGACALTAKRSRKAIGTSVAFLTGSLLLPVIGKKLFDPSDTRVNMYYLSISCAILFIVSLIL